MEQKNLLHRGVECESFASGTQLIRYLPFYSGASGQETYQSLVGADGGTMLVSGPRYTHACAFTHEHDMI